MSKSEHESPKREHVTCLEKPPEKTPDRRQRKRHPRGDQKAEEAVHLRGAQTDEGGGGDASDFEEAAQQLHGDKACLAK